MTKRHISITKPTSIVFFGSPEFALPTLQALYDAGHELTVVTSPPRPIGREQLITPTPVGQLARKLNLRVLEPSSLTDDSFVSEIRNLSPELIVVVAYGKILPSSILKIPVKGSINLHPSLLPKYRGASPIEAAIRNGDEKTGVSIILMDEKLDHGPIIAKTDILLKGDETGPDLRGVLAKRSSELLLRILPDWLSGAVKPEAQNDALVTTTKTLIREDGRLFWDHDALALERQVRAYVDWPESFCLWQRNNEFLRIKVLQAHLVSGPVQDSGYGRVWQSADAPLAVVTREGSLALDRLCLEGRSPVDAENFVNGYPDIVGTTLL